MQLRILFKWLLIIVGIIIILFAIFGLPQYESSFAKKNAIGVNDVASQNIVLEQTVVGRPVYLKIPTINVDTVIESVGLTPKGAMDVPQNFLNVAWLNLGPRPGEEGSSVIDGHSGWKNGIESVFDNLNKIKKGDKIYVEDEKGLEIVFIVRDFRAYSPSEDVSNIFNSNDGKAHLNLITCVAAWDVNQKSPNDRFVVFADKEL